MAGVVAVDRRHGFALGFGQVGVNTPTNISAAWASTPGDVAFNATGTAVSDVTGWSTAEWAVLPFNANFSVQPEFSYAYASTTNWSESAIIARLANPRAFFQSRCPAPL